MATISYPLSKKSRISTGGCRFISGVALFLTLVIIWTLGYQLLYAGRIFPGVSVAGVDLSGMTPSDAAVKLSQTLILSHQREDPLSGW
jgi:hypothetical protein